MIPVVPFEEFGITFSGSGNKNLVVEILTLVRLPGKLYFEIRLPGVSTTGVGPFLGVCVVRVGFYKIICFR